MEPNNQTLSTYRENNEENVKETNCCCPNLTKKYTETLLLCNKAQQTGMTLWSEFFYLKRTKFSTQHLHGGSQSSVTPVPVDLMLFGLHEHQIGFLQSPGHQWNYVDQPGIKSQRSACLYLPITGLEGVNYYAGLNQRELIREYVCEEKKLLLSEKVRQS